MRENFFASLKEIIMRKTKIRKSNVTAIYISEETLFIAQNWTNGSIKGTKLPVKDQELEFYSAIRDEYLRARHGDFIVEMAPGMFDLYSRKAFHKLFVDNDDIPY